MKENTTSFEYLRDSDIRKSGKRCIEVKCNKCGAVKVMRKDKFNQGIISPCDCERRTPNSIVGTELNGYYIVYKIKKRGHHYFVTRCLLCGRITEKETSKILTESKTPKCPCVRTHALGYKVEKGKSSIFEEMKLEPFGLHRDIYLLTDTLQDRMVLRCSSCGETFEMSWVHTRDSRNVYECSCHNNKNRTYMEECEGVVNKGFEVICEVDKPSEGNRQVIVKCIHCGKQRSTPLRFSRFKSGKFSACDCQKVKTGEPKKVSMEMAYFSQEDLAYLASGLFESTSKYANGYVGKVYNGNKILNFIPHSKELGVPYTSFILRCSCGSLFIRECRATVEGKVYSCGGCRKGIKGRFSKYSSVKEYTQEDLYYLLKNDIFEESRETKYRKNEYIGETYGVLKVLKIISVSNIGPHFLCRCLNCGELVLVRTHNLLEGSVISCGKHSCRIKALSQKEGSNYKVVEGDKIYRPFTVEQEKNRIDYLDKKYKDHSYSNYTYVKCLGASRNKKGIVKSIISCKCDFCGKIHNDICCELWPNKYIKKCNCKESLHYYYSLYKKPKPSEKYVSLNYVYIGDAGTSKGEHYVCIRCNTCGELLRVKEKEYLNGEVFKHCYCYTGIRNTISSDDVIKKGMVINDVVIKEIVGVVGDNIKYALCICPCCEGIFLKDLSRLKAGGVRTCGCFTNSVGEYNTFEALCEYDSITINKEMTFDDLRGESGRLLRYDFYIVGPKNSCLIEYDGRQHEDVKAQRGKTLIEKEKLLEGSKKRDAMKEAYALRNGIPLLRISYLEDKKKVRDKIRKFFIDEGVF